MNHAPSRGPVGFTALDPTRPVPDTSGRGWRIIIVAVLVTVAVIGLVYLLRPTSKPAEGHRAAVATPAPSTVTRPNDPAAQRACDAIAGKTETDAGSDPDQMEPIGEMGAEAVTFDIRVSGSLLADHARLARAAKGHRDELTMTLGLMTAAIEFETACIKGGFKQ